MNMQQGPPPGATYGGPGGYAPTNNNFGPPQMQQQQQQQQPLKQTFAQPHGQGDQLASQMANLQVIFELLYLCLFLLKIHSDLLRNYFQMFTYRLMLFIVYC